MAQIRTLEVEVDKDVGMMGKESSTNFGRLPIYSITSELIWLRGRVYTKG